LVTETPDWGVCPTLVMLSVYVTVAPGLVEVESALVVILSAGVRTPRVTVQFAPDEVGRQSFPTALDETRSCGARKVSFGYAACVYSLISPPRIGRR
jgi:hypothetical protein